MQIHIPQPPLTTPNSLSFSNAITPFPLLPNFPPLSLRPTTTIIRMGGGPRTFPGGVSKWQWKRMQAKKAKQLLKARLARERQIYEMRKRAELKAAVADLERPWEVVDRSAPVRRGALFSVSADEQLKVLADRFQKPGGFDLWGEDDGPQLFETPDGLPSARFFPKGVVHSVKPYGRVVEEEEERERNPDGLSDGLEFSEDVRDVHNLTPSGKRENSRFGSRSLRGRSNGKVGNRLYDGGSEESDEDDLDILGSRESYSGENMGGRDIHSLNEQRRRNLKGRSSRKLGNGSYVGGNEESDEDDLDILGSRESYSGENMGGRDIHNLTPNEQRRRNLRGRSNGKVGIGSYVGGIEESGEEDLDILGSREAYNGENMGGRDIHSPTPDEQRRRNLRGRRNGRNLGSRGTFGAEKESNGRRSRNWSGGGYRNNGNGPVSQIGNENGAKMKDSKGMRPENRSNSRRISSRGRNTGRSRGSHPEDVYDMSLQHDGSYGFDANDDAENKL